MQDPSVERHWLRPKSAAHHIKTTESNLAKLRCLGGGPIYHRAGQSILYDRRDLDDWVTANRRLSTSVAA